MWGRILMLRPPANSQSNASLLRSNLLQLHSTVAKVVGIITIKYKSSEKIYTYDSPPGRFFDIGVAT